MISRKDILDKTQYGVGIYCHILHGLYPKEIIMHQVGRDCGMCRNPFAGGEKTLHIERVRLEPEKKLCDEIAIIDHGRLVAEGTMEALRSGEKGASLEDLFLQLTDAEAVEA